jgi:hypothetical protein
MGDLLFLRIRKPKNFLKQGARSQVAIFSQNQFFFGDLHKQSLQRFIRHISD